MTRTNPLYVAKSSDNKVCQKCLVEQPKANFSVRSASWDGLNRLCRECDVIRTRAYRLKHLDKYNEYAKNYRIENAEVIAVNVALYRMNNRALKNSLGAKRYARKRKATVAWANDELIKQKYQEASDLSDGTGVLHNVDHIVPIVSPYVCGLHWEGNLAVMDAKKNTSKGNRWWPDMFEITDEVKQLCSC